MAALRWNRARCDRCAALRCQPDMSLGQAHKDVHQPQRRGETLVTMPEPISNMASTSTAMKEVFSPSQQQ